MRGGELGVPGKTKTPFFADLSELSLSVRKRASVELPGISFASELK